MTTMRITSLGVNDTVTDCDGVDLLDHEIVSVWIISDDRIETGYAHIAITKDRRGLSIINSGGEADKITDWSFIASII